MAEAYTLSTFLTDVGSMVTAMKGWVSTTMEMVTGNAIILAFVGFSLVFGACHLIRKLVRI